jgi:hypothetical protein
VEKRPLGGVIPKDAEKFSPNQGQIIMKSRRNRIGMLGRVILNFIFINEKEFN